MFSNGPAFRSLIIPMFFGLLAGCTIGEQKKASKAPNIEAQTQMGCLKTSGAQLRELIKGAGEIKDLDTIGACADTVVREFAKLAQGKDRATFTPVEIRDFLQRYYLGDVKISDELLARILRVRESFFGGGITTLSGEDLASVLRTTHSLLGVLRDMHPYLPISFESASELSPVQHAAMLATYTKSVGTIVGLLLRSSPKAFSFAEVRDLLGDSQRALGTGSNSILATIQSNVDLAARLKTLWLTPDRPSDEIRAEDLRLGLTEGMQALSDYLTIMHALRAEGMNLSVSGRDRISASGEDAINIVERAIARRTPKPLGAGTNVVAVVPNSAGIPIEDLEALVLDPRILGEITSASVGTSQAHLRERTITGLIDKVGLRVLSQDDLSLRPLRSLTRGHLEGLRRILREWRALKGYVDQAAPAGMERVRLVPITTRAARTNFRAGLKLGLPYPIDDGIFGRLYHFREYLRASPALYDENKRSPIGAGMLAHPYTPFELNILAMIRPMVSTLARAYQEKPAGTDLVDGPGTGLTEVEFGHLVRDLWDVLVDLQFLSATDDPELDTQKRFREASLFNFVSDGDDHMSVHEGTQLVLALAEAQSLGKKMHGLAVGMCAEAGPDEFGSSLIEPNCFRQKVMDFSSTSPEADATWADLPLLRAYFKTLDAAGREEYWKLIEMAGRKFGYEPGRWYDLSDAQSIACLLRYVEYVYERFDQNPRNSEIDPAEAELAYPVFRGQLAQYRANLDEDSLHAAFTWLLANGLPPGDPSMGWYDRITSYGGFVVWKKRGYEGYSFLGRHIDGWAFSAPRRNVMSVFGIIASGAQATASAPAAP